MLLFLAFFKHATFFIFNFIEKVKNIYFFKKFENTRKLNEIEERNKQEWLKPKKPHRS